MEVSRILDPNRAEHVALYDRQFVPAALPTASAKKTKKASAFIGNLFSKEKRSMLQGAVSGAIAAVTSVGSSNHGSSNSAASGSHGHSSAASPVNLDATARFMAGESLGAAPSRSKRRSVLFAVTGNSSDTVLERAALWIDVVPALQRLCSTLDMDLIVAELTIAWEDPEECSLAGATLKWWNGMIANAADTHAAVVSLVLLTDLYGPRPLPVVIPQVERDFLRENG